MPAKLLHPEPEFTLDTASLQADDVPGRRTSVARRRLGSRAAAFATLAVIFGAATVYLLRGQSTPAPVQMASPVPAPNHPLQSRPQPATKNSPEHVVAQLPGDNGKVQSTLPPLGDSDTIARDSIESILGGNTYIRLLAPQQIIRDIVATIDSLPRKTLAARIRPVVPVPGTFATISGRDAILIAGTNAARYTAYVDAAESIDTTRLVHFYFRLYALFQQAYVELGYPDGYFNDRLIGVIDHLLAAPEPQTPVHLTQPKVLFEFLAPELQNLSAGQKILVRVGIENERRLKAKLRDIRKGLTGKPKN